MPFNEFEIQCSENETPQKGDCLLVPIFTSEGIAPNPGGAPTIPDYLKRLVGDRTAELQSELLSLGFKGAYKSSLPLLNWPLEGIRLILVGCGRRSTLNPSRLMVALESSLKTIQSDAGRILISLQDWEGSEIGAIVAASSAASYHLYRSREFGGKRPSMESLWLLGFKKSDALLQQIDVAQAMNRAAARAKDLVNIPPNIKRTQTLADEARNIATDRIELQIQDDPQWIESNMPCFFTVARGSLLWDPPRWIHLKAGNPTAKKRIALVGKSVIYDTGGYQVKPDNYMRTMKADMTGGATVLSVLDAIRTLDLNNLEVHAFLAATPNMISESAMVPDAIVDTTCGKKVEIRHTDAEGRLTLIDAVAMANKTEPDLMITVATLTGSATRAVGPRIALMSGHPKERDRFAKLADDVADTCQTLDVLAEDFEDIASKLDGADINNTGNEKYRGAQTAAAFVMSGIPETLPLLHLDIAGGDMSPDDKATGIACRSIIAFLLDLNARLDGHAS